MKSEIVDSFSQMVKDKKIDRDLLESIIKEVFGMMIKKKRSRPVGAVFVLEYGLKTIQMKFIES